MPDNSFQIEAIGAVYAQALINEAQKQNVLSDVTDDVRGISGLLKSNVDFAAFTQAVTIADEERASILTKIFEGRVHELTLQVLKSLSRRDRLMFIGGMVRAFEDILHKAAGIVDVELVSSVELRPELISRLKDAVAKSTGKSPELTIKIDPSLIGGMTLRIDDTLIDGSVETQLAKIKEQMKTGGLSRLQKNPAAAMV